MHIDTVASCTVFSLTHWWLSEYCVKKQCGMAGCVSEGAWLLTFASPESVQELQRWDKTVTTNSISQNCGEKEGTNVKITRKDF